MMSHLVMGNADVVGLLAYAIFTQFREEWRAEFKKAFGREPTDHECAVYNVGEDTLRRKMTYRFLADSRVMGTYADIGGTARDAFIQKIYQNGARPPAERGAISAIKARPVTVGLLFVIAAGALSLIFGLTPSRAVSLMASSDLVRSSLPMIEGRSSR